MFSEGKQFSVFRVISLFAVGPERLGAKSFEDELQPIVVVGMRMTDNHTIKPADSLSPEIWGDYLAADVES